MRMSVLLFMCLDSLCKAKRRIMQMITIMTASYLVLCSVSFLDMMEERASMYPLGIKRYSALTNLQLSAS